MQTRDFLENTLSELDLLEAAIQTAHDGLIQFELPAPEGAEFRFACLAGADESVELVGALPMSRAKPLWRYAIRRDAVGSMPALRDRLRRTLVRLATCASRIDFRRGVIINAASCHVRDNRVWELIASSTQARWRGGFPLGRSCGQLHSAPLVSVES